MLAFRFTLAALITSLSGPTLAGSAVQQGPWDRRIKLGDQCSFERAGAGKWGIGIGKTATDHGNGIISQIIEFGRDGCNTHEQIVVVNCSSREAVMFDGQGSRPDKNGEIIVIAGTSYTHVRNIMSPVGPLDLNSRSTVDGLIKEAEGAKIKYSRDLAGFVSSMKRKNRPNLLCGCDFYYPENSGATK